MTYIKSNVFKQIAELCDYNLDLMLSIIHKEHNPTMSKKDLRRRLERYRRNGELPLDSGNSVSVGEVLRGTSTMYDHEGRVILQWVKSDVPREQFLSAYEEVIVGLASTLPALSNVPAPEQPLVDELTTVYISNDVHFGLLAWDKESGEDYNLDIATSRLRQAYDYLFASSPSSRVGIVVDLGDLCEVDNNKNVTPKSGNVLAADSRYPKIMRAAYEALVYAIYKALEKHEVVYFYNVEGNHDINTATAIREVIRMAFRDNPRVIVDETPRTIKYHQHGAVLLQFAHGDGMKMKQAGEVMAHDCQDIFSKTRYRYSHLGHIHQDSVYDGRICRVESHRNLAPLNAWAYQMGYRTSPGTMKAITYHIDRGEISRNLFTL